MPVRKILREASDLTTNPVGGPNWNTIRVDPTSNMIAWGTGTSGTTENLVVPAGTVVSNTTAVITPTPNLNGGRITTLSSLAGGVVTLPAATGTGNRYKFMVGIAPTSVSWTFQVASATDYLRGGMMCGTDDADSVGVTFVTATTGTVSTESDTMIWNRTTTGVAAIGDWVEFIDIVAATWSIFGYMTTTGAEATPFSAAV